MKTHTKKTDQIKMKIKLDKNSDEPRAIIVYQHSLRADVGHSCNKMADRRKFKAKMKEKIAIAYVCLLLGSCSYIELL